MHLEHWERLTRGFHGYRLFNQVQPYVGLLMEERNGTTKV